MLLQKQTRCRLRPLVAHVATDAGVLGGQCVYPAAPRRVALNLGQTSVWLGLMWHAKHFAPTALRQAGAMSGAIAGGVGAAVYSLYCPVFDAGYIAVWYVLGIGVCIAFGALAGPRSLRW